MLMLPMSDTPTRKKIEMERASYVPILLTKRGELSALGDLTPKTKSMLTPLFVVHPLDWN